LNNNYFYFNSLITNVARIYLSILDMYLQDNFNANFCERRPSQDIQRYRNHSTSYESIRYSATSKPYRGHPARNDRHRYTGIRFWNVIATRRAISPRNRRFHDRDFGGKTGERERSAPPFPASRKMWATLWIFSDVDLYEHADVDLALARSSRGASRGALREWKDWRLPRDNSRNDRYTSLPHPSVGKPLIRHPVWRVSQSDPSTAM